MQNDSRTEATNDSFDEAAKPCIESCAAAGPVTHARHCHNRGKWPIGKKPLTTEDYARRMLGLLWSRNALHVTALKHDDVTVAIIREGLQPLTDEMERLQGRINAALAEIDGFEREWEWKESLNVTSPACEGQDGVRQGYAILRKLLTNG